MFTLATDVQKIIMEFLYIEEIKVLYETCEDAKIMFNELTKHTNFKIECKRILLDQDIKWFESKNISLKLLETIEINTYGDKYWYKNGVKHRDNDLPAGIWRNGNQYWYKNGKQHRDNGLPAVICTSGSQSWYQNGKHHRDNDLPAVIFTSGTKFWYKNGKRHRDNDLPAIIYNDGTEKWWKDGIIYVPN